MVEEALGAEGAGVREEGGVVVEEDGGHADGGHGRDGVAVAVEDGVRVEPLHAGGDAVADAEALGDDGG